MKPWTLYLPEVMPHVPGCPTPVAINAIRNAAIEFCEKTWCWQATQTYNLTPGDVDTTFDEEENGNVYKILFAELGESDGRALVRSKTQEDLDLLFAGWRDGAVIGRPEYLTQLTSSSFVCVPTTDVARDITLQVAVRPNRTSAKGHDDLYNDYLETIANGAKARLMAMPSKEWTNAQLAIALAGSFNEETSSAKHRVQKGRARAPIRVRAHFL